MKGQGHGSRIPDRRAVLKGASVLGLAGVASTAFAQDVLADLDATGLAQKVRAREVTPLELLEAAINRAEAVNGRLNCLSETLYDRARARADRIAPEGAFAGVPYLLKDETELAGVRRHLGSRIDGSLAMSTKTNPTISRMEAAGVNVFGRTTMSEFGALPHHRDGGLRGHAQSVEPAAYARRVIRRSGRRRRRWDHSYGRRMGRRGFDPHSGEHLRPGRSQALAGPHAQS
jgi:hypothetical protein